MEALMGRTSWILVIAACVLVLTGCGPGERPDGPLRIVVSVPPLQGIAGEVGAQLSGSVQPRTIVDVGQTPHGFELTPEVQGRLPRRTSS
jgi:ABC-type Zn uptake system ZnuABC Zn-binding protein ZnuA